MKNKSKIFMLIFFPSDLQISKNIPNFTNKKGFLLPITLNSFNINIAADAEPMLQFSFGVFTLSLVCLLSFFNINFYFTSIILILKYDIDIKFKNKPQWIKFIKYYTKTTLFFFSCKIILCIISLLVLIISSLFL